MGVDITIFTQFGPWVGLLVVLVFFFRDKLFPALVEDHKARLADEREREDRLFKIIETNTEALTALKGTIAAHQAEAMARLNEDVAGLYGHIRTDRPSRTSQTE
jgi:hypothetical protein